MHRPFPGACLGLGVFLLAATSRQVTSVEPEWVSWYDGPGSGIDVPTAVAVGPDGEVCVTGKSRQDSSSRYRCDFATIKYRPDGTVAWVARFDRTGMGEDDEARDLAVDQAGNV
ncbi:MAG: hypothetical protein JSU73_00450, partial [candidate division WOR-3 bacterium]